MPTMSPRFLKAVILGLLAGTAGVIMGLLPFAFRLEEDLGLAMLFKLRGANKPSPYAIVVSIDKESAERLSLSENPDKWPRSIHARLTDVLSREGAKVIAFDVHFIEHRSAKDDELFAEAIGKARSIVLCEPLKAREITVDGDAGSRDDALTMVTIVKPIDILARSAMATAPFPLPRIPFKVNRHWTFQKGAGDTPTLPVVVFQLFARDVYQEFLELMERVRPNSTHNLPGDLQPVIMAGKVTVLMRSIRGIFEGDPTLASKMIREAEKNKTFHDDSRKRAMLQSLIKMYDGSTSRYINFYGPPRTVTTIPYYQALQLARGKIGAGYVDVKDRAVFVGLSEVLLAERKDSFYTVFSRANGVFISGVEIAATAFSNIAEDRSIKPLAVYSSGLLILFWGTALGLICRMSPIIKSAILLMCLSVLYLGFAFYEFKVNDRWYPLVVPLFFQAPFAFLGAVVWNYRDTSRERENIKKAFEHYIPKDVVEQLARNVANLDLGSKVVYGICLFTDAEHYTTLSEVMDPAFLGKFMNRYYETMFRPVKEHGGIVSGIVGDSMLALWVGATSENTLRERACKAALDIQKALKTFYESSDAAALRTRIGVHCGQILLGNIGALDHYEYTPMGDIVNTASRIEGLNKQLGTSVLVSDDVLGKVDGFLSRELGTFRLVGKTKPVTVHELMGNASGAEERSLKACVVFAQALDAYKKQCWDEAAEKFAHYIEDFGEDGPSRFYLKQCAKCKDNPSGQPWDAVVCVEEK